jgi:uncharacterized protein (TIGR02300 family)
MATKAARGTKRTCQNSECGARFYDLNHDPIVCPICDSTYALAVSQPAMASAAPVAAAEKAVRKPGVKKPEFVADAPAAEAAEGEELAVAEDAEEATVAGDDDTFLEEEEEEGGDVSNIIGGPVAEEGEEP